jgi:D-sedoheptulose 7-phosphate isomerase
MRPSEVIATYLEQLKGCIDSLASSSEQVERVVAVLQRAKRDDRCIFVIGNGGSASTASHLAGDLSRSDAGTGGPGLRAVCLTDNVAALTAMANDHGYESALAELLALQVRAGDVLIAISGSGRSPNILRAVEVARARGAVPVGLIGFGGGELLELVDHAIYVEARHYGVVEDVHLLVSHLLSLLLSGPGRLARPDLRPRSSLGPQE